LEIEFFAIDWRGSAMTIMRILALVIFWGFVSLAYAKSADAVPAVDLVTESKDIVSCGS
jgi:hypothetical protein